MRAPSRQAGDPWDRANLGRPDTQRDVEIVGRAGNLEVVALRPTDQAIV